MKTADFQWKSPKTTVFEDPLVKLVKKLRLLFKTGSVTIVGTLFVRQSRTRREARTESHGSVGGGGGGEETPRLLSDGIKTDSRVAELVTRLFYGWVL